MNAQSAKTPTPRESVTITLSSEEFVYLRRLLSDRGIKNYELSDREQELHKDFIQFIDRLYDKFEKSGDACRHSAQSSDAVGQGGTITCHLCEGQGTYTKLNSSKLFECEWCRGTGLRSVEGDNQ